MVVCNVDFIILDGESKSFLFLNLNLIPFKTSLHAGISTTTAIGIRQAIPESAFVDAVNDYVANSETDDEGDMYEA